MARQASGAELLDGDGGRQWKGGVSLGWGNDFVRLLRLSDPSFFATRRTNSPQTHLRPDCCGWHLSLEVLRVQRRVVVAAVLLLPERGLTFECGASVQQLAPKQEDASEIWRQGDECPRDAAGAGPELQRPLRVWAALAVADDRRLEASRQAREVVDVVGDVLGRDLHVGECTVGF